MSPPVSPAVQRAEQVIAQLQAERDATRQASREMHEQCQEAKALLRELREAAADADTWKQALLDRLDGELLLHMEQRIIDINDHFNNGILQLDERFKALLARLEEVGQLIIEAGLPDRERTMRAVMAQIAHAAELKMDDERFRQDVAHRVAQELGVIMEEKQIERVLGNGRRR